MIPSVNESTKIGFPQPHKTSSSQRGYVSQDSLYRAADPEKNSGPAKPVLPLPVEIINLVEQNYALFEKELDLSVERMQNHSAMLVNIQQKHIDALQKTAEITKQVDTWSFIKNIATALLAAASIVVGTALLTTGTGGAMVAGGVLALSGALSVGALVSGELGARPCVTAALSLSSAALSLIAGGIGFKNFASKIPEMIMTIAQTATGITKSVTTMGQGIAKSKSLELKKLMGLLQVHSALHFQDAQALARAMRSLGEQQINIAKSAALSMERLHEEVQIIINNQV